MNRSKALPFLPVLLLVAFPPPPAVAPKTGGGGGGTGNGSVAVTMVAIRYRPVLRPLPFRSRLASIQVTYVALPGTYQTTVNLNPALTVDLCAANRHRFPRTLSEHTLSPIRQRDLFLSGNANITFLNDTGFTLSGCLNKSRSAPSRRRL